MAAAASRAEEGEGKGLLAVSWAALDELAEMDNGLSSELELGELTPPVAVALGSVHLQVLAFADAGMCAHAPLLLACLP